MTRADPRKVILEVNPRAGRDVVATDAHDGDVADAEGKVCANDRIMTSALIVDAPHDYERSRVKTRRRRRPRVKK